MQQGVARVTNTVKLAIQATFDRIRGIVNRAKARFSKAIPRQQARINRIVEQAVSKASQLSNLDAIKATAKDLKERLTSGEVTKYFRSRKEFVKLLDPIKKRYQ